MNPNKRREEILTILGDLTSPIPGSTLGKKLSVSRQVIVQDISILRAKGEEILATPQGYLLMKSLKIPVYTRTFATCHNLEDTQEELEIMVDAGGKILDVIVEHPIYGELKGMLMIESRRDVQEFVENMKAPDSQPLSILTQGVHLHTVEASNQEVFMHIEKDLKKAGFLFHHNE